MTNELQTLEALLETEAEILRSGRIEKLAPLVAQKEAVWTQAQRRLSRATALPDLARLQEIARRNAHLLVAARAGIDSAKTKTAKAKMPREALSTYNAKGQKASLAPRVKSAENLD